MSMNLQRAGWASDAVQAFADVTGAELWADAISDLICNLGHLSDSKGLDFKAIAAKAVGTWRIEQDDPEGVSNPCPVTITITITINE